MRRALRLRTTASELFIIIIFYMGDDIEEQIDD